MTRRTTRRTRTRVAALLPLVGLLAAGCGSGSGASGGSGGGTTTAGGDAPKESCYEGKNATFVVPFSPGGGYDTIARGLAPFLKDELGASTVVVENQPGAGGLKAANSLYKAEPDGLTFGLFAAQGIVGSSLAGAEGASYDPKKFTYVARLAEDARVLLASPKSGLKSIEDVTKAGALKYATAGTGAADHVDANVVPTILGIKDKIQIVTGFKGSSETELAVTSGQVELGSGTLGTRINGVKNGDQVAVLLMGREQADDLPDVPALLEMDLGDKKELAEAYVGLQEVGRSVFAPPGMEEGCLTELQDAFKATLDNAEFQKQIADKVDVPFEYTDGKELREAVDRVLDAPEELVTLMKQAYAGK